MHLGSSPPGDDVDWDSIEHSEDPRRAYDALRDRHPVVKRDTDGTWLITGHAEVRRCALDVEAFSNRVSSRLQIPNGFDGDEHRRFRSLIDGFLCPSRVAALRPQFRIIAEQLAGGLLRSVPVDAVWQIGAPLAIRFQCAWLGWQPELEPALLRWMKEYRSAMLDSDPLSRARAAEHFEAIVLEQLRRRKDSDSSDVTSELLHSFVEDPRAPGGRRPLLEIEAVSILRNWTAGDLGTIAACVGIVAQRVAADDELQLALRAQPEEPGILEKAIDECLRIDDPFLSNRRTVTKDVEIAERVIPAGARVLINWTAANRDPTCIASPDEFRPDENAPHNLVYGVGPHACPGRELATMQLRETLVALLRCSSAMRLAEQAPSRAAATTGGYDQLWITLE